MQSYDTTTTTTIINEHHPGICNVPLTKNCPLRNYINYNPFVCRSPIYILSSTDPAFQYQTQKRIQNTVRVKSSLYTDNLAALNIFQYPRIKTQVNWNQMSDRALPHFQTNSTFSQGSFYHGNSRRHPQTRCQPGATNPGGLGVDIKHNSYCRYLGRLKAKRPFKREAVPSTFGKPIPFNPAFPIYGAKTLKTNIVSGCNNCPLLVKYNPLVYEIYDSANKLAE